MQDIHECLNVNTSSTMWLAISVDVCSIDVLLFAASLILHHLVISYHIIILLISLFINNCVMIDASTSTIIICLIIITLIFYDISEQLINSPWKNTLQYWPIFTAHKRGREKWELITRRTFPPFSRRFWNTPYNRPTFTRRWWALMHRWRLFYFFACLTRLHCNNVLDKILRQSTLRLSARARIFRASNAQFFMHTCKDVSLTSRTYYAARKRKMHTYVYVHVHASVV